VWDHSIIKINGPFGVWGMAKFGNYVQEAYDELVHKVSWPSWDELQQTTIIVLVSLVIITALIFGMDFASENVLKFIYGLLGK
jgi:preprotein translocase subunit SecE